jgi:hypothetical protein
MMRVADLPVLLVVALLGHWARPATAQPAGGGDWSSDADDSGYSGDSGGDGGDSYVHDTNSYDDGDSSPNCAWNCYSCTIDGTCVSSPSWPKSERPGPAF